MAEPIIYPDSPLAHYLNQSVPNEFSSSEPPTMPQQSNHSHPSTATNTTLLQDHNHHQPNRPPTPLIISHLQSFLTRFTTTNNNNNISTTTTTPINPDRRPSSEPLLLPDNNTHTDSPENQLSERLKYLICSSFLLNPGLQPDFYDTHPTPPMVSELAAFSESQPPNSLSHSAPLKPNPTLDFISSFRFFRPHPRIVLSLSTLLILIGCHVSPGWALFSLPVIALTLFRPRTLSPNHLRHIDIIPHLEPRTLQLEIQSAIVPEIAKLVNKSQALDLRVSRAIGAVKEIECVALGLGLSNPMPPVSRLETAAFPFAGPSSAQQSNPNTPDLSQDNLHALGVRKVLQRVLDQARHEFENTAVELESVIVNPTVEPTSAGSSTLSALMEMYGCSRLSSQEPQSSLRGSTSERARRQAWRASLHSRIHDNALLLSPVTPNEQSHLISTPPNSKRFSLQAPLSPHNASTFESQPHLAHLETRKLAPLASRKPRCRSSFGTPSQSYEYQLKSSEGFSPTDELTQLNLRRSPGSRPVSFHVTHSPTPAGTDGRRSSLLIPVGRSPKPRPCSMSATSFRTLSSSSPISHARRSPELLPVIHSPSSPTNHFEEPNSPVTERVVPYSLVSLQNSFERMHISRKRLMCCLLALDFTLFTPNTLAMWQDTLETVQGLLKTVESLGGELTAGMTAEFGPGSFDTTPVARSSSNGPTNRSSIRREVEGEESTKAKEVRDFGPPIPEADKKAKRHGDLLNQMQVMDLALRTISAKMKVCVEELEKETQGESHGQRAISVHESIRADLESLAREWDESRSKIRVVVEGEKVPTPGRSRLRPHSLDSNEGSMSLSSGRASSIYSSELLTPVGEHAPGGMFETEGPDEEDEDESGPLLASTVRAKSMAPPPGLEELLAGAVAPVHKADRRSGMRFEPVGRRPERRSSTAPLGHSFQKPPQLSAEEQAELTRRRRESASFQPRSRPHSLLNLNHPSSASPSASSSSSLGQTGIVTELKDVLHALKTRRTSTIDSH